ncbi:MAG: NUDIX hydrolase [Ornithinimicrobium sp.]
MGLWTMQHRSPGVGELTWSESGGWWLEPAAAGALAEFVAEALANGLHRVEAQVSVDNVALRRTLQRAGLRPEGIARGQHLDDGEPVDVTRLARLASDPPPGSPPACLAMLNATLPTKRVIAQGLIRNERDEVLMCGLTYKKDWDLPGGVVDPGESPAAALKRECREELGVSIEVGELLATNWLPPYRQWDDAVLLVFDLGVHPDLPEHARLQPTEIASLNWCDAAKVEQRAAPYVGRLLTHLWSTGFDHATERAASAQAAPYLEDGQARDAHS